MRPVKIAYIISTGSFGSLVSFFIDFVLEEIIFANKSLSLQFVKKSYSTHEASLRIWCNSPCLPAARA